MKKIHNFNEVFDAQKLFRAILTAMSNPGKRVRIEEYAGKMFGQSPAFLAIAMTLLDNEVSFNACDDDELTSDITSLTLAVNLPPERADFIFLSDPKKLQEAVENAKSGTLRDPHKSATIIFAMDSTEDTLLRLSGPGIKNVLEFRTSKAVLSALEFRDRQYFEYPQGIDFIFITDGGDLFALPRLTRREV